MNYKDAYCHMLRTLNELVTRLEQPREDTPHVDTAVILRRLIAEGEEIRIGQNPYPVHKAPRSGSSMR